MIPLIFTLLCQLIVTLAIPIDNGVVGVPQIECGPDSIAVEFVTQNPFMGRIYVKGYSNNANCIVSGDGLVQRGFNLGFNQCGIRRERQINPPGVGIAATVVISFHSIFITKVDRAYRINCFYMEASKSVTQQLEISMLTTAVISHQLPMPVCQYDITTLDGNPIRFARIGDAVFHRWTCLSDSNDMFCMRVHTCTVDDGQGGLPVTILDANGCAIDEHILQNLNYPGDLTAGQEAHVFKFADRPALYFNCQIELRLKDRELGCAAVKPRCNQPLSYAAGKKKKRSVMDPSYSFDLPQRQISVLDIESIAEKEESPVALMDNSLYLKRGRMTLDQSYGNDICVSRTTTIVLVLLISILMLFGCAAIFVSCYKRRLIQDVFEFISNSAKERALANF